jgi:hypothetical protein
MLRKALSTARPDNKRQTRFPVQPTLIDVHRWCITPPAGGEPSYVGAQLCLGSWRAANAHQRNPQALVIRGPNYGSLSICHKLFGTLGIQVV